MQSDLVQYRRDGHVATITYNRPDKLNAIDGAMRTQINDAFARFRDDDEAWVGVVTGAGRAFCVGADLGSQTGNPAGEFPGSFWERPTVNSFESGWEIFKPVIAAVNGYCLGYGLTLLTWCDFVLASERAEFGFPEVRVGVPTIVGALRLPQRINWQYAMELLLTGERIDARRALEIGLAGWVVPPEELMDRAYALAERLLAGAPLAQRAIKEMAVRGPGLGTTDAIRFGETMRKVAAGHRGRRRRRGRGPRTARTGLAGSLTTDRRGGCRIPPDSTCSPVKAVSSPDRVGIVGTFTGRVDCRPPAGRRLRADRTAVRRFRGGDRARRCDSVPLHRRIGGNQAKGGGPGGSEPDIVGVTWFLVALGAGIYLAASYVGGSGGVG